MVVVGGSARIIEGWKDLDALRRHFATPHIAIFQNALKTLKTKDLSVRMYRADPESLPA